MINLLILLDIDYSIYADAEYVENANNDKTKL